jgi:Co/Zn/Cd efflux system component
MRDDCCASCCEQQEAFRPVLWIALAINLAMFGVEIGAAVASRSNALQADALDFLGDAANYGVSLTVSGLALSWRARAALAKGSTMAAFGLWVMANAIAHLVSGTVPEPRTMGVVSVIAMAANGAVALMLYRFRVGEANMRSVWICARNDVLGNIAVLLAAMGVAATGERWPDSVVAVAMACLALTGGWSVNRQAVAELRAARS